MTNLESQALSPRPVVEPRPRHSSRRLVWLGRQIAQITAVACVAFASYFIVSHFFVQSVQVVGSSMQPTLQNSEHYLLNRWILRFRLPRPGEIVVIRDPYDQGYSVKRIIAQPGDRVVLGDGTVTLNGKHLEETYLPKGTRTFPDGGFSRQELHCGPDQFVVLGDNRGNSADSRSYGPVSRQSVLGIIIQ